MRYIISGRNITVTEGLKEAIYDKLGKLEKYFTPVSYTHLEIQAVLFCLFPMT